MSKFMKIVWTFISYAPLYFVAGISLLLDSITTEQITNQIFYGVGLIVLSLTCVPCCFLVLHNVKKKVSPTKLIVKTAESGDENALSSMIAYLFPLVTLTIAEINVWIFWALIIVYRFNVTVDESYFHKSSRLFWLISLLQSPGKKWNDLYNFI